MTVADVCRDFVVTARPDETVPEAACRMRDQHVGDMVVVGDAGQPVGMLTDRDIVVSAVAQSPDRVPGLLVGDVMTRDVATIRRHETVEVALKKMRDRGVRRLPVVTANGRVDGILAFDDIISAVSAEMNELVGLVAREQTVERNVRR